MVRAMAAVKRKEMPIRGAAKAFGVSRSSLHRRVTGQVPLDAKPGPEPILTDGEVQGVLKAVDARTKRGLCFTRFELSMFIRQTPIPKLRAKASTEENVDIHFNNLKEVFESCEEIPPSRIWNLDETGVCGQASGKAKEKKRIAAVEAKQAKRISKAEAKEAKRIADAEAKEAKRIAKVQAKESKRVAIAEAKVAKRIVEAQAKRIKRLTTEVKVVTTSVQFISMNLNKRCRFDTAALGYSEVRSELELKDDTSGDIYTNCKYSGCRKSAPHRADRSYFVQKSPPDLPEWY
ncbi:unnamed protein product [Phytophthora fragariaefolia]|uniref:Unnamed protein product n=1 Tax=Phytophthora fragariaefolia TaxID=1490495 RepID=A0A9W6XZR0_9STRA|nr:unnamed protein product [Phytophthora fragariaefolia]